MASNGSAPDFRAAAHEYFLRGWTCVAVGNDDKGKPKRALTLGWPSLPHEWGAIADQQWERATGISVVLGESSDNLGVIDLDDSTFAHAVLATLRARAGAEFYYNATASDRGHLFFRTGIVMPRQVISCTYQGGERFDVELRGKGNMATLPPSPGYMFLGTTHDPTPVASLAQAWDSIARSMGVQQEQQAQRSGHGWPKPWKETLDEGSRNNALFVESCRLAEAKMPLDSAIATMQARVQQANKGKPIQLADVERTVRSAYRRVNKPKPGWI